MNEGSSKIYCRIWDNACKCLLRKAFAFLHKRRPAVPYVRRRAAFA